MIEIPAECYDDLENENNELRQTISERNQEIKRLNKRIEDLKTINEEHQVLNGMLRKEIERLTKQNKALNEVYELTKKEYIRLNNIINKVILAIEDIRETNDYYNDYKVDNSILSYWIDLLKDSDKE